MEGLIDWLREIAVDHPLTAVPPLTSEPATDDTFTGLPDQVAAFLTDLDIITLVVQIRYGDAVSVSRLRGALELGFHAAPRHARDKAAPILALFDGLGVRPSTD